MVTKSSLLSEKFQINITLLSNQLDMQIEAHNATKNSISILIAAIALLISALPNKTCPDIIFIFQLFAAGLIIYAITLLTIILEVGPNIQLYFINKKDLSVDEYTEGIQELFIVATQKNIGILANLNQKYYILRILVMILVIMFILITFIHYVR